MTAAQALKLAGALTAIGGYLSEPANVPTTLSPSTAHYITVAGGILYVVGQALEHYFTKTQVQANTKAIADASTGEHTTPAFKS